MVRKYKITKYRSFRVLNKSRMNIKTLLVAIDFCLPKQLKRHKIDFLFLNKKGYKKTLKVLKLEKAVKDQYPFRGLATTISKDNYFRPLVIITTLSRGGCYYRGSKRSGYIQKKVNNPYEDLILVLSHELKHIHQYKLRVSSTSFLETWADRYAIKKVEQFRKLSRKLKI